MKVIKEIKAETLSSLFYGAKLVIAHNPDYLFQMLRMHSGMKPGQTGKLCAALESGV